MIDERPPVVLVRERIGDFEGDLILGRHGLSMIGTLVDRATRYIGLVQVPEQRRSEDFTTARVTSCDFSRRCTFIPNLYVNQVWLAFADYHD
jgi:transposase, IS30 family